MPDQTAADLRFVAPGSVACVVPTHGRDHALGRALQSVAMQSTRPTSVVVVDDLGSPSTRALVEEFSPTLPAIYLDTSATTERGAGASRNRGADASPPTEFIAFLDDDDFWDPSFLEQTIDRAVRTGAGLVAAWARMQRGDVVHPNAWHAAIGRSADEILASNPGVTGSNFVIRRALFDAVGGFDAHQWVFNDLDFLVRCLDAGVQYDVVQTDLVTQTAEPGEHLSSRSDRRAEGIARYIGKYRPRLSRHQLRALRRQQSVARLHAKQTRLGRLRYGSAALWNASVSDIRRAVSTRIKRDRGYD